MDSNTETPTQEQIAAAIKNTHHVDLIVYYSGDTDRTLLSMVARPHQGMDNLPDYEATVVWHERVAHGSLAPVHAWRGYNRDVLQDLKAQVDSALGNWDKPKQDDSELVQHLQSEVAFLREMLVKATSPMMVQKIDLTDLDLSKMKPGQVVTPPWGPAMGLTRAAQETATRLTDYAEFDRQIVDGPPVWIANQREWAMYKIAGVAHNANREFCRANGTENHKDWNDPTLDDEHRKRMVAGVKWNLENPDAPDSAQHVQWMARMIADGWTYAPGGRDEVAKTHHCLLPYDELPQAQKAKDRLFRSIVKSLAYMVDEA